MTSTVASPPAGAASQHGPSPSISSISADERLLLISLLETSQFGPAVKAIFDRQWYASHEYHLILNDSLQTKQDQIKAICEEHYAEFLAGIEHLLSVKLDLSELRQLVSTLNSSVQQSGRAVLASARQLNEQRRLRYQINIAKQVVSSCSSLISYARKARIQISQMKYFSALKTLNQLQRILHIATNNFHKSNQQIQQLQQQNGGIQKSSSSLGVTSPPTTATSKSSLLSSSSNLSANGTALPEADEIRFEFLSQLQRQIPLLTNKIKENVSKEFIEWLGSITKRSTAIGELALAQLDEYLSQTSKQQQQHSSANGTPTKKNKRTKSRREEENIYDEEDEENGDGDEEMDQSSTDLASSGHSSPNLFDAIPINFTPIYQCLHIYEHLNQAETFQNLYKEKRTIQLFEHVQVLNSLNVNANTMNGNTLAATVAGIPSRSTPSSPASPSSPTITSASALASAQQSPSIPYIETYSIVFASITGFFIIEDNILKSGNELISRAEIDSMYEKIQVLLIEFLEKHFDACATLYSPSYLLSLKYLCILFIKIMDENYLGHDSRLLLKFLEEQRVKFETILLKRFHSEIGKILMKEKWEPLCIKNHEEYSMFILDFALQDESINVDFPCTMPFSISIPMISRILTNFVEDYSQYAKYLSGEEENGEGGEANESDASYSSSGATTRISTTWRIYILQALDRALLEEVNTIFLEYLSSSNTSLLSISQTVQFSINAQVLSELTCSYLERLIRNYGNPNGSSGRDGDLDSHHLASSPSSSSLTSPRGGNNSTASPFTLTSRHEFLSTKLRCEDLLFELISEKITDFLDIGLNSNHSSSSSGSSSSSSHTGVFNWTPDQPFGPDVSSEYITELLGYLETTFYHMSFMPDAVREAVHFTSCKLIADTFMDTLASQNSACKKFNIIGIYNLNQDLKVIEQFTVKCAIQNLIETFSEIRQLIDLLLSDDIDVLLDSNMRNLKYPHLSTQKLLKILDKFKDISMFSLSTPAQFKKLKKKQVENVVKQLAKK